MFTTCQYRNDFENRPLRKTVCPDCFVYFDTSAALSNHYAQQPPCKDALLYVIANVVKQSIKSNVYFPKMSNKCTSNYLAVSNFYAPTYIVFPVTTQKFINRSLSFSRKKGRELLYSPCVTHRDSANMPLYCYATPAEGKIVPLYCYATPAEGKIVPSYCYAASVEGKIVPSYCYAASVEGTIIPSYCYNAVAHTTINHNK